MVVVKQIQNKTGYKASDIVSLDPCTDIGLFVRLVGNKYLQIQKAEWLFLLY